MEGGGQVRGPRGESERGITLIFQLEVHSKHDYIKIPLSFDSQTRQTTRTSLCVLTAHSQMTVEFVLRMKELLRKSQKYCVMVLQT